MSIENNERQLIKFPLRKEEDWRTSFKSKLAKFKEGFIEVDCKDWPLSWKDLVKLKSLLERSGFILDGIYSQIPETLVSAYSLGLPTNPLLSKEAEGNYQTQQNLNQSEERVLFHEGTLRSGEHIEARGDVLLLGDVNPGAQVSAGGNVMIWGRLLGIAHAGKTGNLNAKIIALELRPLQLRIANEVARGPEGKPEPGLAEEAILYSGSIVIRPAQTIFVNKKTHTIPPTP